MSLTKRIFMERRRVILPLLAFLVANVVGLGAVVWLQRGEANAEIDRLQTDSELADARKQAMLAKDQKTRKERADLELRKFYAEILPKDFATAQNMTNFWLDRIAASARLRYRGGTFDPAPVRDSRLIKFTGEVTLVGEYADIRRFLYEVETAEEFLIIEKVALSQPNATQGGGQLEVALTVATYFLSEPPPGAVR
jgi:hypothetical protein